MRQTGKLKLKEELANSAAIQAMNPMQMRQKGSDFPKTKEYNVHGWPGCLFFFCLTNLN